MPKKGASDDGFEFEENEIVLAYFGKLLYEAKIMTREYQNDQPMYFVHYQKWQKKFDEWLDADRIVKRDEAGLKQMQQLKAKSQVEESAPKGKASGKRKASAGSDDSDEDDGRSKKRKGAEEDDDSLESDDENSSQLKMIIPPNLQKHLLLDFESIKDQKKLVNLPKKADCTVAAILEDWRKGKGSKKAAANPALTATVAEGLRTYFDKLLPIALLYSFEMPQMHQLPAKTPSQIYGVEHLLRLFAKLPEVLAQTEIAGIELKTLMSKIAECLKFINSQSSHYFGEYSPATSAYLALVKEEEEDEDE